MPAGFRRHLVGKTLRNVLLSDPVDIFLNCSCSLAVLDPRVGKGKVFPYSLPSVGPGADPGVQAVSPQVT